MVGIDDVLKWKPAQLPSVTDALLKKRGDLTDLQDEVDAALPPYTWVSPHATTAREKHEKLRLRLLDMVAEVGKVAASVDFAEAEVKAAKDALEQALDSARAQGFQVDHATGQVTDSRTYADEMDALRVEGRIRAVADAISTALTNADVADADLAKALQAAIDGHVDGGDGSLGSAGTQLPSALEGMSAEEIAKRYANDVALETVQAWLNVELELATWEAEAGAKATYIVRGDGSIVMALHLEGGLGREVDAGAAEMDVSGGLTTDLELTFKDEAEAEEFLKGLDDAAFDLKWYEYGNAPGNVAANVAEYINKQDVTSFKTGVYGQASAEFDTSWADGDATGRVDGYYDWAKEEYGLKVSGEVSASNVGGQDSGVGAKAAMAGEVKLDTDGNIKEAVFTGSISGSMANDKLGLDIPGSSTGAGADVEIKMDSDNPHFEEFSDATKSGDLDKAADLALDHGRVVVRTVAIEEIASEEHEIDAKIGGIEVEYGANAEVADDIWVRPAGKDYVIPIDPQDIDR